MLGKYRLVEENILLENTSYQTYDFSTEEEILQRIHEKENTLKPPKVNTKVNYRL